LGVDSTWTNAFMTPGNVCSTDEIQLDFTFLLFGDTCTSVIIIDNGFLELPTTTTKLFLAPFSADVDIRNGGDIYYKMIDSNSFAVAWVRW
jgi:hypothetical protein